MGLPGRILAGLFTDTGPLPRKPIFPGTSPAKNQPGRLTSGPEELLYKPVTGNAYDRARTAGLLEGSVAARVGSVRPGSDGISFVL